MVSPTDLRVTDESTAAIEEYDDVERVALERKRAISDKIVSRLRTEVDRFMSGTYERLERNLMAVTFPSLLDFIVERSVSWARGEVPIEDIVGIAADLFDLVELNQEVNEQAELHISNSNQRIRRGTLGAMMHALNESVEGDTMGVDDLVEGAIRAVRLLGVESKAIELSDDEYAVANEEAIKALEGEEHSKAIKELVEETQLGQCGRSLLNSVLHQVSVTEALCKKEVATITDFGAQSTKDMDEAKLKAAFKCFCPGKIWVECRAADFVCNDEVSCRTKHR